MIHKSGDLPVMFSIPSYGDIRGMVDWFVMDVFSAFTHVDI
ncbi:hypothetical protein EV586_103453 [Tumebacillus sp. BK434]|nr:hypothetical protein EV586_103453 [Tumebacillus sp. BK434]